MQVNILKNPSTYEFRRVLESLTPNFVYLQGKQADESEEIGSLEWGNVDLSTPEILCELFGSTLPVIVSIFSYAMRVLYVSLLRLNYIYNAAGSFFF